VGRACSTNEIRNAYRVSVGKSARKRALERPRRRWVDNTKTDLREIGWVVWNELISLRIGTSRGLL
jgi:hypothetical protein